jgi:hypothetical protein
MKIETTQATVTRFYEEGSGHCTEIRLPNGKLLLVWDCANGYEELDAANQKGIIQIYESADYLALEDCPISEILI